MFFISSIIYFLNLSNNQHRKSNTLSDSKTRFEKEAVTG